LEAGKSNAGILIYALHGVAVFPCFHVLLGVDDGSRRKTR
jgi:hypothetical protein